MFKPAHALTAATTLCLVALSSPALAHAPSPGLQGFWRGFLHPLTDPMQYPVLIAFALAIGPLGLAAVRRSLSAFGLSTLLGFAAGIAIGTTTYPTETTTALLSIAAILSLAAILRAPLPPTLCALTGILAGSIAGFANVPEQGEMAAFVVTSLGSLVAVNIVAMLTTTGIDYLGEEYDWPWLAIGWRVLAAWTLAIAALALAITLR